MKILYRLLFLVVFLGLVPLSCERCNSSTCECETDKGTYQISDMGVKTVMLNPYMPTNSQTFHSSDSLAKALFIKAEEQISMAPVENFSLSNTAIACSPLYSFTQEFQSIKIYSVNALAYASESDSISKGEIITDRFEMTNGMSWQDFRAIERILQLQDRIPRDSEFLLKLAEAPYKPVELIINIEVTLSDGQVFSFNNEVLKVK